MQPYQHVTARGHNGAITLGTQKPSERFVLLGASCSVSVKTADGPVSSFTVVPKRATEVVALAVLEDENHRWIFSEVLLLRVQLKAGKAEVDLNVPFGGSAKAMAQMVSKDWYCQLRLIEDSKTRTATWSIESLRPTSEQKEAQKFDDGSFDALCVALVELDSDRVTDSTQNN